jgi:hypothetical protein
MTEIISLVSMDASNFQIIPVLKTCKMIDFAMEHIDNYDPDSGNGYYQLTKEKKEYISPKTEVVLVSEVSMIHCMSYFIADAIVLHNLKDKKQRCTGSNARNIIGVSDKRELLTLPDHDLSGTQWKYVFIQSISRVRMLCEGTHFMFCKIHNIINL